MGNLSQISHYGESLGVQKAKANALQRRQASSLRRNPGFDMVSSLTSSTSSKQLWKRVKAANWDVSGIFSSLFYKPSNSVFSSQVESARGRSTLDNLVFLESQIRDAFVKRNHLVSLFFDIEEAYDRTWRYGIL
ncbi:hypothetical protein TNCV_5048931, partial [Trichonephila clavipes]